MENKLVSKPDPHILSKPKTPKVATEGGVPELNLGQDNKTLGNRPALKETGLSSPNYISNEDLDDRISKGIKGLHRKLQANIHVNAVVKSEHKPAVPPHSKDNIPDIAKAPVETKGIEGRRGIEVVNTNTALKIGKQNAV